jgi:NAD(P)-dependent dehydrogenase (short-subunit alcohol dehydrogenase family)
MSLRVYQDAVAIITGGASGIGKALGEALAQRGATAILADRQSAVADEVAAGIRSKGGKAVGAELDVRDFEATQRLVEATIAAHGRLDFMFNNAGIGIGGEARDYQIDDWVQVLDVNLRGVVNGVQAAYPVMVRQGFGHIVNTASMAGLMPSAGMLSYATSKHAVVGLSTSLRIEAAPEGVRVSVLCPGVIRTPILEGGKYGKTLNRVSPVAMRRYWERLSPLPPEQLAERALRAIQKNRPIIIVPSWWKAFWWLNRLSPAAGLWFSRKLHEMGQKALQQADE